MRNKLVDDRYRIVSRIGQGAMGIVFKAEHTYTMRPVALKVIHPQYQRNEQYRTRFLREIELACRVQHPNAVQILDAGEVESRILYMAMEYLDGETLSRVLKQHPGGLSLDAALHIIRQIALALDAIHNAGLVHRDLKPDNIMVLPGPAASLTACTVKILDFGIAHDIDTRHSLTGKSMIGTPKFMSPEQTRGEKLTRKSDIYNLGLILYAMLTGKEPFSSDSPVGYVFHHNMTQPAPVSSVRSDVPAHIEWTIQKALSKNPDLRFESAAEFMSALTAGEVQLHQTAGTAQLLQAPASTASGYAAPAFAAPEEPSVSTPFLEETIRPVNRKLVLGFGVLVCGLFLAMYSTRFSSNPSYTETPLDSTYTVTLASAFEAIDKPVDMSGYHLGVDTVQVVVKPPAPEEMAPVTEDAKSAEALPARQIPAPAAAPERSTSEYEMDPNLLYYANLRTQPRYVKANLSIEENSNIRRLREEQRRVNQAQLQAAVLLAKKKQGSGRSDDVDSNADSPHTLPRVQGGVDKLRAAIRYPEEAAKANVTGTVGVRLLIDEKGNVTAEDITQSVGFGCDDEVLRVLQNARFEPAKVDNKPVKAWLNLQFSFQLMG